MYKKNYNKNLCDKFNDSNILYEEYFCKKINLKYLSVIFCFNHLYNISMKFNKGHIILNIHQNYI